MNEKTKAVIRQQLLVKLSETTVDVYNDYSGNPCTAIFHASWIPDPYDLDDEPFAEVLAEELPDLIRLLVATFKEHIDPEAYEEWLDLIPPPEKVQ